MDRIVIIGCGDIGRRVARRALAQGQQVHGLVREEEKGQALAAAGIAPLVGHLDDPESLTGLPLAGAGLFYFAPPPGGGFSDPRVRNFLAAIAPGQGPAKIVYISTSGVYGDCGDKLVTEETPPNPQTSRARRRLDAENAFLAWGKEHRVPVVILRVTGIYGPGRLPVARLTEGHPLLREEECKPTNRIHAEDLARVCLAAMDKGEAGDIFNVCDGQGGTMTQYFLAVADLLSLPQPKQIPMAEARQVMAPLMISYLSESRRMDNRKMLEKLEIRLDYPTLAEGLQACLDEN
ncbi:SDR family oxidoreductase [Desulfuromonas sp. KJ2020]|uniref:SDR family oxidoreductase n=1 Tax=Desulfuromonas sp. KJ2020 TaxID=2919173 RepID=UPI0020A7F124|nr:SDR family oxidoreductase [Desulfuromonas sp. KJ2020]MCP3175805.1 SDR family oxidoreductase [Desulfuromonas sp. KJ2020]